MGRGKARPGSGHRVQRSGYKSKLHQESERARPSERLRQEGKKRSAQGQTRAERSAVKAEKAKRGQGLYQADRMSPIKRSEENYAVTALYDSVLKGRVHELLHVDYVKQS